MVYYHLKINNKKQGIAFDNIDINKVEIINDQCNLMYLMFEECIV